MAGKVSEFGPMIEPQVFQPEIPKQNLGTINAAKHSDSPLLLVFDISLSTAGTSVTCFSESEIPDFWICSLVPNVGTRALVYNGPQISGVPMRLGGGGYVKVPGLNEYFTIYCSAPVVNGTVFAIRKYADVTITGGTLA